MDSEKRTVVGSITFEPRDTWVDANTALPEVREHVIVKTDKGPVFIARLAVFANKSQGWLVGGPNYSSHRLPLSAVVRWCPVPREAGGGE